MSGGSLGVSQYVPFKDDDVVTACKKYGAEAKQRTICYCAGKSVR